MKISAHSLFIFAGGVVNIRYTSKSLFLICSLCKPWAAQSGGVSTAQRDFQFPDHQWLSYPKLVSEICFKQNQYQIQRVGDETSIYSGSKMKVF